MLESRFYRNSPDGDENTFKYSFTLYRVTTMMEKLSKNKELRIWTYIQLTYILLGILITQLAEILTAIANVIQALK